MGNAGSGSGLLHEEVMDVLEEVQCKATAMTEGLVHPAREEILRELGLFILRKKRFGRILTAVCEYLREGLERAEQSPVLPSEKQESMMTR